MGAMGPFKLRVPGGVNLHCPATAVRCERIAAHPSLFMFSHLPTPHCATPSTSASASASDHGVCGRSGCRPPTPIFWVLLGGGKASWSAGGWFLFLVFFSTSAVASARSASAGADRPDEGTTMEEDALVVKRMVVGSFARCVRCVCVCVWYRPWSRCVVRKSLT
jgi:hypothetical protein